MLQIIFSVTVKKCRKYGRGSTNSTTHLVKHLITASTGATVQIPLPQLCKCNNDLNETEKWGTA